jgi:hypothetical protein
VTGDAPTGTWESHLSAAPAGRLRPAGQRDSRPRSKGGTGRLQALADGFFAVAVTLLVLDLAAGRGTARPVSAVLSGVLPPLLVRVSRTLSCIPVAGSRSRPGWPG